MKPFEIKALGLEEMNASAASSVNGGDLKGWIGEKIAEWLLDVTIESFRDGTQSEWYQSMLSQNPYYCPLR